MAAPARSVQLLLQILSIQNVADAICNELYRSLPQPVELDIAQEQQDFLAVSDPLFPIGLQQTARDRRWGAVDFMDGQSVHGRLDTPIAFQDRLRNIEIMHDLDLVPHGTTAAAHAASHYGMAIGRRTIGNILHTFRGIQDELVHQFNFSANNLANFLNNSNANRNRFRSRLTIWVDEARLPHTAQLPGRLQIKVALADLHHRRRVRTYHDVRTVSSNAIATRMMNNLGHTYWIR